MLYLCFIFNKSKYWASPFINLINCLKDIFDKKNIECEILENSNKKLYTKDILIIISGIIHFIELSNYKDNKIIIINSESVNVKKNESYLNKYINNPNVIQIWDYSIKNINRLKELTNIPCYYVPITYDLYFEKIYDLLPGITKEIDICLYGCKGGHDSRRNKILNPLKALGYNIWVGSAIGNENLAKILNMSKIVIIVHYYEDDICIDYYRLCSLISNKIFTIHEKPSDDQWDPKMDKLLFEYYDNLVDSCSKYLSLTQQERDDIALDIYKWWKKNHLFSNYIPKIPYSLPNNNLVPEKETIRKNHS